MHMRDKYPWVLVAGGFHRHGGMDKANMALAQYLTETNRLVHIVCHSIDSDLSRHPLITLHNVPRPGGSTFLGEPLLDIRARSVARSVTKQSPLATVVVNGGNCRWAGVNWVHSVHHAWHCVDSGAPSWFKVKNRISKGIAKKRELRALRMAHLVVANSERTRLDLIEHLAIPAKRVHVIYLGTDPSWCPPSDAERIQVRRRFEVRGDAPLIAFVGALSHDNNKGFDVLWSAWRALCARDDWDGFLVVAGGGSGVRRWMYECGRAGLSHRVRFLGFTTQVPDVLKAADLLISPVRYEAYGLNVHEAICHGVPAIVSASAGIAERYPVRLFPMLLQDVEDVPDLVTRILAWRANRSHWQTLFLPLADELRRHTWRHMAEQIVSLVESVSIGEHLEGAPDTYWRH
jgi:glycosyltransferase involved in cell wall biosynthesis